MTVQTLIDKAVEKVGTRYKLYKVLNVSKSQIYDWYNGTKRCCPADRARLAALANDDPVQELVRATLEETEGTPRGDQLKVLLGKLLPQTGEGLHGVVIAAFSGISGVILSDNLLRCIKSRLCDRRYTFC
jgi:hypothetical protein